jgi:GT2 family glycosyltransferase
MLSLVIPTYRREKILLDTICLLQPLRAALDEASELLVIDQTEQHQLETEQTLAQWHQQGVIRWIRLPAAHLTRAMNTGLLEANGEIVLYLDDDIIPSTSLLQSHLSIHRQPTYCSAVVGQVLQPGQIPENRSQRHHTSPFWRDFDFPFNSTQPAWIENAMAGNMSIQRMEALRIGGFDEHFPPPVAARFESEFAKRLIKYGGRIRFEPSASIHHLAATSGGTRSRGSHLTSASPRYGIGDYYFALRTARGWDRFWYILRKPFREVRTRFHLTHPWWIPAKLIGEVRAFAGALSLYRTPPALMRFNAPASGHQGGEVKPMSS